VKETGDHGWDVDLDDGSTNYHIYNNLFLNGGLKLREGFYRIVENNIMVNNSFHPHVWYGNSRDTFRHNIVFTLYRPIRVNQPWGRECDFNLLHTPGKLDAAPAGVVQQAGRPGPGFPGGRRLVHQPGRGGLPGKGQLPGA
jgi:hypothetical protein